MIVSDRYLIYQPNHGFGVELLILETAFELARCLDRTLVLPPMPDLETTNYRRSLDEYFEIPSDFPWMPFAVFQTNVGLTIDVVYHIRPFYRLEYCSREIRDMHPVWADNIESLTAFTRIGIQISTVVDLALHAPLTCTKAIEIFDSDCPTIGISYISGLLEGVLKPPSRGFVPVYNHVPRLPTRHFVEKARRFAKGSDYAALHWRRGFQFEKVALLTQRLILKGLDSMVAKLPQGTERVVVASDCDIDDLLPLLEGSEVIRYRHPDPQINAVVDIALCIDSAFFVGAFGSTFSLYIAYARLWSGKSLKTTILD